MLTLVAMFLVAYVQVVFGIECTIRSLRKTPFRARGKYDVTICLFVVFVLEILTWALAFVDKMGDFCFASLVWFVVHYGEFGTIVVSSIIGASVICGLIIWNRLSTVPTIDKHQRIAASRMVYYLWLGAIVLVSSSCLCTTTFNTNIASGFRVSLFPCAGDTQKRLEAGHDSDCSAELVRSPDRCDTTHPARQHISNCLHAKGNSRLGAKEARDQAVGTQRPWLRCSYVATDWWSIEPKDHH